MNLERGMKVRVKENLHYTKKRNLLVIEMKKFAGTVQTIESVSTRGPYTGIYLKGFLFDEKDVTPIVVRRKRCKPELFNLENLDL